MKYTCLYFCTAFFWSLNLSSLPIDIENLNLSDPESQGMKGSMGSQLDEVITKFIEDEKIQGAVVVVSRFDNPIYFSAHGLADIPNKIPMERDSMFQMWSSTKAVLGVAAMIAVDRGLFKPEDEVSKYIPEFKDLKVAVLAEPKDQDISPLYVSAGSEDDSGFFSGLYSRLISWLYDGVYLGYIPEHRFVPLKKPVTIHDLLTHTAGIATGGLGQAIAPWNSKLSSGKDKNAGTNAKDFLENITIKSFTEMLSEGPLDFQPGSRHQYSGFGGMDVVARLIEITSNQPFNEFVQNNIFEPLDMHDTHWRVPDHKLGKIVEIAGGSKGGSTYQGSDTKFFSGSVGLVSTARDFLHLHQMLINGGKHKGNRILSKKSFELMSTDQAGDLYSKTEKGEGMGFGYAVSLTVNPEKSFPKAGLGSIITGGAAGTVSWSDPENKIAAVIMVQQPTADFPNEIAEIIFNSVEKK